MKTWEDIEVGRTYRFRNSLGQELDRTVVSVTEKKLSTSDMRSKKEILAS